MKKSPSSTLTSALRAFLFILAGLAATLRAQTQPNFLFIAVDDLKVVAGFMSEENGSFLKTIYPDAAVRATVRANLTPNLDALAARSVVFRQAFTAVPVCEGSRTAILIGQRAHVSGIYGNTDPYFRQSTKASVKNAITLPQNFKNQGYYVAGIGKIFHGQSAAESDGATSWNNFYEINSGGTGYTRSAWCPSTIEGTFQFGANTSGVTSENDYAKADFIADALETGTSTNGTNTLTIPSNKPFFLACGIFRPHGPWKAPSDMLALFPANQIQITRSLWNTWKADSSDLSSGGRSSAQVDASGNPNASNKLKALADFGLTRDATNGDLLALREQIRHYLACIATADRCIGRLIAGLDAGPYKNNTVVVLWSDHGYDLGEKLHLGKLTLWNESARSFLMIKDPARTTAANCDRPVGLIDMYKTMSKRAGLTVPSTVGGNDLAPLVANPSATWNAPALTTYKSGNHALRFGNYSYIRFNDSTTNAELYNLTTDPDETTNLINNTAHATAKTQMNNLLTQILAGEITP